MGFQEELTSPAGLTEPWVMRQSRVLVLEQKSIPERGKGFVGGHLHVKLAVGGDGEALARGRRVVKVSVEPPRSLSISISLATWRSADNNTNRRISDPEAAGWR